MKVSKILLGISLGMLLIAVVFLFYALNHPEGFIKIPVIGTKGLYLIYIGVMITLFLISRIKD